ncbi:PDZ domain-containing protein, partial [Candidatus Aminicenantes bacterium AC-334-K16]|nr:PDZ domain-containing protein [Candidatus Aminicenantes bacterium AC-334-K16]
GEIIKVRIRHRGKGKELEIRLGEYPEEDFRRESEKKLKEWFPKYFPPFPPPSLKWTWKSRRYIGLYLQELNRELSAHFGVKEGRGLLVSRVEEDSPAARAGLRVGDVIIRADGRRVETVEALSRIIQQKEEGERIEIEFLRDKKKKKVEVEVAEEESSFDAWFNLETSPHFRQRLSRWSKQVQKVSQETMSQLRKKMADINRRAEENMIELSRKLKELSRENIFQPQIAGDKKFRGLRV